MPKAVLSFVFAALVAGAATPALADVTRGASVQDRESDGRMMGCEVAFIVDRDATGDAPPVTFGGALLSYTNRAGQAGMGINLVLIRGEDRTKPLVAWLQAGAGNRDEHRQTVETEQASLSVLEVGDAGQAELAVLERTGATRVAYELTDGANGAFDLVFPAGAQQQWKSCLARLPQPAA